ncbi:MAG: hypothetical protein AMXMBFR64_30420 [Myxococcales bacterium]
MKPTLVLAAGICVVLGLGTPAAAVPGAVQVQGTLATSSGVPAAGDYTVIFKVWSAETGGTALYTWPPQPVQVTAGLFDAELPAAPDGVFNGAERWLEIAVQGEPPLPRRPFRSVPYALVAGQAETAIIAGSLACSGCVGASELDVPWAGSSTPGGPALDLACTGCVGSADLQDGGVAFADLSGAAVSSLRDWTQLLNVPAGFADGVDNVLSEAQVETFVTNAPINLAAGSTIGGQPIGSGSSSLKMVSGEAASLASGATLDVAHPSGLLLAVTAWYQRGDGVWEAIGGTTAGGCSACGTGNDGAYDATSSTTLAGGTYNFSSFRIRPGVTVTVTGGTPLIVLSKGDVLIEGTLNLKGGDGGVGPSGNSPGGAGGAGGGGGGGAGGVGGVYTSTYMNGSPGSGGAGGGSGGGVQARDDVIGGGGGGGGFASTGATASAGYCCTSRCGSEISIPGGAGGSSYGAAPMTQLLAGSGGGGGGYGGADNGCGGGGGGGGGAVKIVGATIKVTGTIDARGGKGGDAQSGADGGGGGGGSGGSIWLRAASVQVTGSALATGGGGGTTTVGGSCGIGGTGGAGSAGRVQVDAASISGSTSPAYGVGSTSDLATASWEITQPNATTVRLRNGSQTAWPVKVVVIHP